MDCENLGLTVGIPQSFPTAVLDRAEAQESDQPGDLPTCETAIASLQPEQLAAEERAIRLLELRAAKRQRNDPPAEPHRLSPDFDLCLAVLAAMRAPNERFTRDDIAAVCGCSDQTISNIEDRALKKLRSAIRKVGVNPEDIHFTEHSFANRADRAIHE